jgi:O-antigen/teichoic acid export membrane protein
MRGKGAAMDFRDMTARNMGWIALSQFVTVGVYQLVLLFLATLLSPQDFGSVQHVQS